jgi:hypothetical protein
MADWSVHPSLMVDGADVPKPYFIDQANAAIGRGLNTLATDLPGLAGSVPAVRSGEAGLDYVSDLDLRGRVLAGYRVGRPSELTAASLTINAANVASYHGRTLICNRASAQTLTIDGGVGDGFCLLVSQKGAGQVTIAAAGGLTLRNASSHTKTGGQWARVSLEVEGSNLWLAGTTAA